MEGTPGAASLTCQECWRAPVAGGRVRVIVDDARKRLPEIFRHLHDRGVPVSDVTVTEPTLESVFIELADEPTAATGRRPSATGRSRPPSRGRRSTVRSTPRSDVALSTSRAGEPPGWPATSLRGES